LAFQLRKKSSNKSENPQVLTSGGAKSQHSSDQRRVRNDLQEKNSSSAKSSSILRNTIQPILTDVNYFETKHIFFNPIFSITISFFLNLFSRFQKDILNFIALNQKSLQ